MGILEDGSLEPLSISLGNQESYNAWKWFLEDMVKRGLGEPILTVIDGCPVLIKALKEVFPVSDIQWCTKHRTENVLDKVLKEDRDKVKESLRKIFYALITYTRTYTFLIRTGGGRMSPRR